MSVIMFQDRFADKVRDGSKIHTIRLPRKRPIKRGDKLSLRRWIGKAYRSKQEVLKECVCESALPLSLLQEDGKCYVVFGKDSWNLSTQEINQLAIDDGFSGPAEMLQWFQDTHGLPFHGTLIQWKLNENPQA